MAGTMAGIGECEHWANRLAELKQAEEAAKSAKQTSIKKGGKK